jgi:hypothetical protein
MHALMVAACAGQAVVQIAESVGTHTAGEHFAMKFFLSQAVFDQEKALYQDEEQPLGQFLPRLHSTAEEDGAITDSHGRAMPPCIIMEKGESLDLWAARNEDGVDMVTGLQVRTPHAMDGHGSRLRGWGLQ